MEHNFLSEADLKQYQEQFLLCVQKQQYSLLKRNLNLLRLDIAQGVLGYPLQTHRPHVPVPY